MDNQNLFFIKDGIIDESTFCKEKIKVLFILKEVNAGEGDNSFDKEDGLIEFLLRENGGNRWRTWDNICRWTIALLDKQNEMPDSVKSIFNRNIRRVAAINLNKHGGGASSDMKEVQKKAEMDKETLTRQILSINPDIIICCGRNNPSNATILKDSVLKDADGITVSDWKRFDQGGMDSVYWYYNITFNGKTVPVVSFVHPQMRGGNERYKKKYKSMVEIRKQLLG